MVSHRASHARKKSIDLARRSNIAKSSQTNIKSKKKVTWDKSIIIGEEEFPTLEDKLKLQGREQRLPLVTFIEIFDTKGVIDKPLTGSDGSKPMVARFYLENGRVDVPKVLSQLGVSQLQYEQESGVWHILKALPSGKSTNKFQRGQVVHFKIIPENKSPSEIFNSKKSEESRIKCQSYSSQKTTTLIRPKGSLRNPTIGGQLLPWKDKWIVDGDTIEDYYGRVSRLIEDRREQGEGLCGIGIVLRLAFHHKHTRLLLTCRHILARDGENKTNPSKRGQLYAFGGPVKVVHVSNKYDLALLQGPLLPGSTGFNLAPEGAEQPGREVRLLTFPWYLDNLWGQLPLKEVQPSQISGHIASMEAPKRKNEPLTLGTLATYMGGLPGCSGAAVTLNSKFLCGVHSGIYPTKFKERVPYAVFVTESEPPLENHNSIVKAKPIEGIKTGSNGKIPRVQITSTKRNSQPLQLGASPTFTRCSSTHGYLAVYVSSSHIRETCLEWYAKPRIRQMLDGVYPYKENA